MPAHRLRSAVPSGSLAGVGVRTGGQAGTWPGRISALPYLKYSYPYLPRPGMRIGSATAPPWQTVAQWLTETRFCQELAFTGAAPALDAAAWPAGTLGSSLSVDLRRPHLAALAQLRTPAETRDPVELASSPARPPTLSALQDLQTFPASLCDASPPQLPL